MPPDLTAKKALITGGTRGIGKAIAHGLATIGVKEVLLNYVQQDDAARQTMNELTEKGLRVHLLRFNLAYPAEISLMFEEIRKQTDTVHFFVHCAALTTFKPLHSIKPNQWDLTLNISARSFLQCVQGCVPLMADGGKVVAVSSTGSQRFNLNYGALGVAKSTLESMVRYLAVELAAKKIQINGVVPGMIAGDSLPPFPDIEDVVKETLRRTPAGRLGSPEDVVKVVLFLLTQADWMYGQNIIIDGGYCLT